MAVENSLAVDQLREYSACVWIAEDRGATAEMVVKLGGGVLAHPEHFDAALASIGTVALDRRLLVVPGGGPFADAVREVGSPASTP